MCVTFSIVFLLVQHSQNSVSCEQSSVYNKPSYVLCCVVQGTGVARVTEHVIVKRDLWGSPAIVPRITRLVSTLMMMIM